MDKRVVMGVQESDKVTPTRGRGKRASPRSVVPPIVVKCISPSPQHVNNDDCVTFGDADSPDNCHREVIGTVRGGRRKKGQGRNSVIVSGDTISPADCYNAPKARKNSPRKSPQKQAGRNRLSAPVVPIESGDTCEDKTGVSVNLTPDLTSHDTRRSPVKANNKLVVAKKGTRQSPRARARLGDVIGKQDTDTPEQGLNNHKVSTKTVGVSSRKKPAHQTAATDGLVSGDDVAMATKDTEAGADLVMFCDMAHVVVLPKVHQGEGGGAPKGRGSSPRGRGRGRGRPSTPTVAGQDVREVTECIGRGNKVGRVKGGHVVRVPGRGRLKKSGNVQDAVVDKVENQRCLSSTMASKEAVNSASPCTGLLEITSIRASTKTVPTDPQCTGLLETAPVVASTKTAPTEPLSQKTSETSSGTVSASLVISSVMTSSVSTSPVTVCTSNQSVNAQLKTHATPSDTKHTHQGSGRSRGDTETHVSRVHLKTAPRKGPKAEGTTRNLHCGHHKHTKSYWGDIDHEEDFEPDYEEEEGGEEHAGIGGTSHDAGVESDDSGKEMEVDPACFVACQLTGDAVVTLGDTEVVAGDGKSELGDDDMTVDDTEHNDTELPVDSRLNDTEHNDTEFTVDSDPGDSDSRQVLRTDTRQCVTVVSDDESRDVTADGDDSMTDYCGQEYDSNEYVVVEVEEISDHGGRRTVMREVSTDVGDVVTQNRHMCDNEVSRDSDHLVVSVDDTDRVTEAPPECTEDSHHDGVSENDTTCSLRRDVCFPRKIEPSQVDDDTMAGGDMMSHSGGRDTKQCIEVNFVEQRHDTGHGSDTMQCIEVNFVDQRHDTGHVSGVKLDTDGDITGHLASDHRGSEDGYSETSSTCSQLGAASSLATQQPQGKVRKRCWKRNAGKTLGTEGGGKKTKITLRRPDRVASGDGRTCDGSAANVLVSPVCPPQIVTQTNNGQRPICNSGLTVKENVPGHTVAIATDIATTKETQFSRSVIISGEKDLQSSSGREKCSTLGVTKTPCETVTKVSTAGLGCLTSCMVSSSRQNYSMHDTTVTIDCKTDTSITSDTLGANKNCVGRLPVVMPTGVPYKRVVSARNPGGKTTTVGQTPLKLPSPGSGSTVTPAGQGSCDMEPSSPVVNPSNRTVIVKESADKSDLDLYRSEVTSSTGQCQADLGGRLNKAASTKVAAPLRSIAVDHRVAVCKDRTRAVPTGRINRSPEILPVCDAAAPGRQDKCARTVTLATPQDSRVIETAARTETQTAARTDTQMTARTHTQTHRTIIQSVQAQRNTPADLVTPRTSTGVRTTVRTDSVGTNEGQFACEPDANNRSSNTGDHQMAASVGNGTVGHSVVKGSGAGEKASPVVRRLNRVTKYTSGRIAGRPPPSSNIIKMISMGFCRVDTGQSGTPQVQSPEKVQSSGTPPVQSPEKVQSSQTTHVQSSEKSNVQSSEKSDVQSSAMTHVEISDKAQVQVLNSDKVQEQNSETTAVQCLDKTQVQSSEKMPQSTDKTQVQSSENMPPSTDETQAQSSAKTCVQRLAVKTEIEHLETTHALRPVKVEVPAPVGKVPSVCEVPASSRDKKIDVSCIEKGTEVSSNGNLLGSTSSTSPATTVSAGHVTSATPAQVMSMTPVQVKNENDKADRPTQDSHLPSGDRTVRKTTNINQQKEKIWKVWKSRFQSSGPPAAVSSGKSPDGASVSRDGDLVVDTGSAVSVSVSSPHVDTEVDRGQGPRSESDTSESVTVGDKREAEGMTGSRTCHTEEIDPKTCDHVSDISTSVSAHSYLSSETVSLSKRLTPDAEPHRHDERPSKVLRLSGVADGHQVAGSDQHSSVTGNSYMRTIQMCLNADNTDHSVWDSLALVFRKLLGRYHDIWTEHLAAMVMVIAKDMNEVTSRLGQFLLALQRKNIEVSPHLFTDYLGRVGASLVEKCVEGAHEEHIYGIITHLHTRGTHVYPFQGGSNNCFVVAKAMVDACLQHGDVDLAKKLLEENRWLYRDDSTCRSMQLRLCSYTLWQICQLLRESPLRGKAPYIIEMFSFAQFLFVALCQDSVEDAETWPNYKKLLDLSAIFDELLQGAMEKKVPEVLLQVYSCCIGLTTKDIMDMRLRTHRDIILFLYAHRQFDAKSFQEAVLVANHATVCGLYPEQPKPVTTGCTIRLWTCMSQQEMYLVTYAYLQELKQRVHNSKLIHGAISNMHIVLERLPNEPRYENVFGTICGTVKVHQHRVEQMAQNDFDPPLSGSWLHSNDFKLDPACLEAYLTYTRSGTMIAKAPSGVAMSNRSSSKTYVKSGPVDSSSSSGVSSFSQNAVPSSVSPQNQSMLTVAVKQEYGVKSFGRSTLPPGGLSANRPTHELNHGYDASQFSRSALSPNMSPVKQPVGGVTRGYGGLSRVTQQRQRLGDSSHGNDTDNRSRRRTTHWGQPTPSPSPSLPSVLPPGTDFSVPPPAVVPARQLSTPGGATKRVQTAAFRHGGRLDTKRRQLSQSVSATTHIQYTDTNDVSASYNDDESASYSSDTNDMWQSGNVYTEIDNSIVDNSMSTGQTLETHRGHSTAENSWNAQVRGDMKWGTEIRGNEKWGTEIRGAEKQGIDYKGVEEWGTENRGAERWRTDVRGEERRGRETRGVKDWGVDSREETNWGTEMRGNKSRHDGIIYPGVDHEDSYPSVTGDTDISNRGSEGNYHTDVGSRGANIGGGLGRTYASTSWGAGSKGWGEKSSDATRRWGGVTNSQSETSCYPRTKRGVHVNSWGEKGTELATTYGNDVNRWGDKPSDAATKWGGDETSESGMSCYPTTRWGADANSWGEECRYPGAAWSRDTNIQGEKSEYESDAWDTNTLTRASTDDQLSGRHPGVKTSQRRNMYTDTSSSERVRTPPVQRSTLGQGMGRVHSQCQAHPDGTGRREVTAKVLEAVCDRLQFHVRQSNLTEEKCDIVSGGIAAKFCQKYVADGREFSDELFNTLVEFVDDKVAILQS